MNYKKLFENALYDDKKKVDEYFSGNVADIVFNTLKDNGFDCTSTFKEVRNFIEDTSHRLKWRDIEEIAKEFFLQDNCDRNFLQKLFGKKAKKAYR